MKTINVNKGGRFLEDAGGKPFFWLADTAWELFHRTTAEEAAYYLDTRAKQGFNVIQAVILAECDGLRTPNSNGHTPLHGEDPDRPDEYYFRFVDRLLDLAEERGLYMALLPTWGDKVHAGLWGVGPAVFDEGKARRFGLFLGKRYRDRNNILWVIGGDRPAEGYEPVWTALAVGIEEGRGNRSGAPPFFTFHPPGGSSSSRWFHDAPWLHMNMLQSGHSNRDQDNWNMIKADYDRLPTKPVLDGEPCYEDHPVNIFTREWEPFHGRYTDYDVRKQAYRAVFSGACGHTYGHHGVWQFWNRSREAVNNPMIPWEEAVLRPGACQMGYLRKLMEERPSYFDRLPDQSLIKGQPDPPTPREESDPVLSLHARACRSEDASWFMVYYPGAHQELTLDLSRGSGTYRGRWFDTRTGEYFEGETYPAGEVRVRSPLGGPDWVLVLDRL